jgi:hypothetical protein
MRALITASFDPAAKKRLEGHMDVVHEDWKARNHIYFDGAAFAKRINDVGADVLIVEADLVHSEVLDGCRLAMIGCCRGEPVNIDLGLATEKGVPVFHTPGPERRRRGGPDADCSCSCSRGACPPWTRRTAVGTRARSSRRATSSSSTSGSPASSSAG